MRIAHVTSVLSRCGAGVSAVVEALSGQQAKMGQDVQVFGLQDADWLTRDEAAWTGARATALKVSGPKAFGYAAELAPRLRHFAPDVVHLHGLWTYPSWAVSRHSDQRWGCPRVISPHGMLDAWAMEQSALKKRVARAGFEGRNLRGAARLHALCAPEEAAIKAAVPGSVIATIPNGVEPRDAKAATYAPPWRDLLPTDAKVLLFLGRLHPKKGLDALIEALARLTASETSDWHLVIGGWGKQDYVDRLKMLATTLEPARDGAPRVLFAGPLYDTAKAAALCHADAFILPSHSEGMPMSVLEAWAHGLPTLLTPECNIPEGYEQGAAVAITTDAEHLAQSLTEFFALPQATLRDIGARGLALANTQYSWPSVCKLMIQLYQEVRMETNAA